MTEPTQSIQIIAIFAHKIHFLFPAAFERSVLLHSPFLASWIICKMLCWIYYFPKPQNGEERQCCWSLGILKQIALEYIDWDGQERQVSHSYFLRVVSYSVISAPCDSSHYFFCVHSVIASITSLVKDIWETLVGVLLVLLVNSCGQLWGEMTEGFVCPSHDQIDLSIVIGWWIVPYKTFWWLCFRAAAVQHKKAIRLGR